MKKSKHTIINKANLEKYVLKAQKGSKRAMESIVKETSDYIYYYCLTLLCDEDKALEAVQDIYVILLTKIHTVEKPETFLGWLKVVTSNYCKNKISRKRDTVSIEDYENIVFDDDVQINPQNNIEKDEICKEIMLAVKQLPDYQKECVLMYYYHQLSISEIAKTLEIKEGTVKSRLFNARKAIKSRLQEKDFLAVAPLSYISYSLIKDAGKVKFSSNVAVLNTIPMTSCVATKVVAVLSTVTAGAVATGGIIAHTARNSQPYDNSEIQAISITEKSTEPTVSRMKELFYANGLTDDDLRTTLVFNENEDINSYDNKNYIYDLMCNAIDNYKTLQGTYFYVDTSIHYYSSYCISFENGANSKEIIANTKGEPISFYTYDGLASKSFQYGNHMNTKLDTFSELICDDLILKRDTTTEKDFERCVSQSSKSYEEALELDFVSMIASKNRTKEDVGYSRMDYANLPMSYVQYLPQITASTYLYDFDNWQIVNTNAKLGRFVPDRICYSIKGTDDGSNGVYSYEMFIDKETGALIYFLGFDSTGKEVMTLISYEFDVTAKG